MPTLPRALLVLLLTATQASPATVYVSTGGSDSTRCDQAQQASTPRRTINAGIACLSGGDTLLIGPGTYDEGIGDYGGLPAGAVPIPSGLSAQQHTVLKAQTPGSVTLRLPLSVMSREWPAIVTFEHGRQWITLDGFVLDGEFTRNNGLSLTSISHSRFQNLHITRAKDNAIKTYGGDTHNAYLNLEISSTALRDGVSTCGHDTCGVPAGQMCPYHFCHAVYLGCPTCDSSHNVFDGGSYHDNDAHALQLYGTNNTVRNVRIHNNTVGIGLYGTSDTVEQNALTHNAWHVRAGNAQTTIRGNTLCGDNRRAITDISPQRGGLLLSHPAITAQDNIIMQVGGLPIDTLGVSGITFGGNICDRSGEGCSHVEPQRAAGDCGGSAPSPRPPSPPPAKPVRPAPWGVQVLSGP